MEVILDASVLADIFIKSRPRHKTGCLLSDYIKREKTLVTVPYHAILEVKCAIDNERLNPNRGEVSKVFTEESPLNLNAIPIDKNFLQKYFILNMPYIKTNDLIYILIAKKRKCPLITEDKTQAKIAKSVNVAVYTMKDFLDRLLDFK
ncbi:MAG: PIN domain-containing protein [Planctomycetota bacterium]